MNVRDWLMIILVNKTSKTKDYSVDWQDLKQLRVEKADKFSLLISSDILPTFY